MFVGVDVTEWLKTAHSLSKEEREELAMRRDVLKHLEEYGVWRDTRIQSSLPTSFNENGVLQLSAKPSSMYVKVGQNGQPVVEGAEKEKTASGGKGIKSRHRRIRIRTTTIKVELQTGLVSLVCRNRRGQNINAGALSRLDLGGVRNLGALE